MPSFLGKKKPKSGVTFRGEDVEIEDVAEAKATIKRLKLNRKELMTRKKAVNAELAQIRAQRQVNLGKRGSMMSGGGGLGKTVRAFQRAGRDNERANHAKAVEPFERRKAEIDAKILELDQVLLQLERYIVENS